MAQDLSKRGKVGDVYRGGSYKKAKARGYKTAGLSADQMKKATTLKGKKVSAGQMKKAGVLKDISSTRWEKGKGVVGPGGKAFTGTVQLASGKTASYVKGRRVGVGPAKKAATPTRRSTTTRSTTPSKPTTKKVAKPKSVSDYSGPSTKKVTTRPKSPSDYSKKTGMALTLNATPWDKKKKPFSRTFNIKPYGIYK